MTTPPNPPTPAGAALLRSQVRALRAERGRIAWWRRLVRARLDLAVARAAGPQRLGECLDLDLGEVPDVDALEQVLAGTSGPAEVARLVSLRDLDVALRDYQGRVEHTLDDAERALLAMLADDPLAALGAPPVRVNRPDLPTLQSRPWRT